MTAPEKRVSEESGARSPVSLVLSVLFHAAVAALIVFWFQGTMATQIVAAGPGEGGEGGGGSIEVGVADPSSILGFAKPQPVSFVGNEENSINNQRLEASRPEPSSEDALLPPTDRDVPDPDAAKTNRPLVNQNERIFTGKDERGRSATQSAQVGRSYGSPTPTIAGGVGIGSGGAGAGTGLPGGSEYGRRIQSILSRNYNPAVADSASIEYVVIVLRISRDGNIMSVSNGRVNPAFIRRRSSNSLVNAAAERAVLAANPLPPFPAGFLSGTPVVEAEVWFRYPK